MAASTRLKNQHLLWRSAFGPMIENFAELDNLSQKQLWDLLVKTSSKTPVKIDVAQNLVDGFVKGVQDIIEMQKKELDKEQKKKMREQSREDLKNLNIRWLDEMINSEAQLREKVALFWHGHFSCRVINSYFQQELLDVIRANALGSFKDLLRGVSKSAAMLQFLNNQQNKKAHPNENFAREVMELFAMGRGNYTENDIKEAARAFTGWGFNISGEFVFRKNQHDTGSKTLLGKTGNFNGDDVINILLEQKQTATFITKKIYKFFVNENTIDNDKVEWLANRFYQSGYDIKSLLQDIFTSDWFYAEKNIGTKIKSPIELLVGIRRFLPMEMNNDQAQLLFQRTLGQVLFYPPNVAGWPGGKTWIDSSTLMLRLRIPQILTANEVLNIRPKDDDDVMMGQMMETKMKKIREVTNGGVGVVDWSLVNKVYASTAKENLLTKISETLIQTKSKVSTTVLSKYINNESRENYVKSAIVNSMSTPEYQLC
jgi:uncharacterized protein (DUF1800 family)